MCVCVSGYNVNMWVGMFVCMHLRMHAHTEVCMNTYMYVYIYSMYVCICACMHAHAFMHAHVFMHVWMKSNCYSSTFLLIHVVISCIFKQTYVARCVSRK